MVHCKQGIETTMSKILYFGNLPFNITAADLTKLVKPFSEVISARIGLDRKTYKSRGFGFVEVPDQSAKAVIEALHGTQFHGRELKVNESAPRPTSREEKMMADRMRKEKQWTEDNLDDE
jgi:RNA recognition motif-containing protein